ncbi:MAG: hypothetical protein AABW65_01105, partial [Nanoarchaeota archaeon]
MVFKRYIKRGGKLYGPYYYENHRVNGKVVSTYVRGPSSTTVNKNFLAVYVIVGIILITLLYFFAFNGLTGKIAFDIEDSYKGGEKIDGIFKLNLQEGELIPKDSKVTVNLGGQSKEFLLSEIISNGLISGNYYAIEKEISGSGEGYGILGSKIIYPTIDFEILISKDKEIREERREAQEGGREQKQETKTESKEEKQETKTESKEEKQETKT